MWNHAPQLQAVSHLLFDPIQGPFFQPADLGLGDPHLFGYLPLGLSGEKPQGEDPLFPVAQVGDGVFEAQFIQPVGVLEGSPTWSTT